MFTYKSSHRCVILLLYVDDMIIIRDDSQGINMVEKYLNFLFDMTNLRGSFAIFLILK